MLLAVTADVPLVTKELIYIFGFSVVMRYSVTHLYDHIGSHTNMISARFQGTLTLYTAEILLKGVARLTQIVTGAYIEDTRRYNL